MNYHNPILPGMFPDPSIARIGERYYLANSTFQYFPGIALSTSEDLLNWRRLPGAITQVSQADLTQAKANEGIFAVNLRAHAGALYAITTNFAEFKTFILRGEVDAHGEIQWADDRVVVDVPGIDPDLYFEGDRVYVQFTGYVDDHGTKAIRQVEIDLQTGECLTQPQVLTYGTGGRDVEGPHIIKHDDWYYLLAAEGGTASGHMITMFRSRQLWGPYTSCPENPLFTNRDRASEPLQNIGHGDLFQDHQGNWWLVCLGTQPTQANFQEYTLTGRETLLYPVNWEKAWPKIYTGVPTVDVDLTQWPKHAAALPNPQRQTDWQADFNSDHLDPEWLSIRVAPPLSLASDTLTLNGTADALSTPVGHPGFLGVRLTDTNQTLAIDVAPQTKLGHGRVGLVFYHDQEHYFTLQLAADPHGGVNVYREQRAFDLAVDTSIGHLATLPTHFECVVTPESVNLKLGAATATTSARHFSNEVALAWNTGAMMGISATEDAALCISAACRF